MERSKRSVEKTALLSLYALRIREGHLVGMTPDPVHASPCSKCVQLWLKEKNVWCEPVDPSEVLIRKDILEKLKHEQNPHLIYQIETQGTITPLASIVFPHRDCICNRGGYEAPTEIDQNTQLIFSPITHINTSRFGTPTGNLWLMEATGTAPLSQRIVSVEAVAREKALAREEVLRRWLEQAALADYSFRRESGEPFSAQVLQTNATQSDVFSKTKDWIAGSGHNEQEALLRALHSYAKMRTVRRYTTTLRKPMMVVGTNNWLSQRVPFFLVQQYDLHCLFYPNAMASWVVGIVAFPRQNAEEPPFFAFGSHGEVMMAFDQAIGKLICALRPTDFVARESEPNPRAAKNGRQLQLWWTKWIYQCPKISLKDVLHLEPYPKDLELWKNFFRDGELPLLFNKINSPLLPQIVSQIVKINYAEAESPFSHKVQGIGTWNQFQDSI